MPKSFAPQATTVPSSCKARASSKPAATATALVNPAGIFVTLRKDKPVCPADLLDRTFNAATTTVLGTCLLEVKLTLKGLKAIWAVHFALVWIAARDTSKNDQKSKVAHSVTPNYIIRGE